MPSCTHGFVCWPDCPNVVKMVASHHFPTVGCCVSASIPPPSAAPMCCSITQQTTQRTIGQAMEQMEIHQHAEITDGYLHPFTSFPPLRSCSSLSHPISLCTVQGGGLLLLQLLSSLLFSTSLVFMSSTCCDHLGWLQQLIIKTAVFFNFTQSTSKLGAVWLNIYSTV